MLQLTGIFMVYAIDIAIKQNINNIDFWDTSLKWFVLCRFLLAKRGRKIRNVHVYHMLVLNKHEYVIILMGNNMCWICTANNETIINHFMAEYFRERNKCHSNDCFSHEYI